MELTVLGTDATWPRAGGAASGYLVRHDGFNLWMDAGTGTFANLQRHLDVADVDAVAISHWHCDHFLDLYPFFYARHLRPEPLLGLPLFAPPGFVDLMRSILSEDGAAELDRVFDFRSVEPGERFEAGPFRVATAPMRHPVPTMAMRLEAGGRAVAYSADTGPTEALPALAAGAEALLCEATLVEPTATSPDLHLSAGQAGEHAARAGVGRLVMVHTRWGDDPDPGVEQAAGAFDGGIAVAHEGMVI